MRERGEQKENEIYMNDSSSKYMNIERRNVSTCAYKLMIFDYIQKTNDVYVADLVK